MMKSEFIEKTGFEPTAAEYKEIEYEYMGTDLDKDTFCRQWKKQGGADRLMRLRARRIEELEAEAVKKDRLFEERTSADAEKYYKLYNEDREKMMQMKQEMEALRQKVAEMADRMAEERLSADEARRKMAVIREAFEILAGKGATED